MMNNAISKIGIFLIMCCWLEGSSINQHISALKKDSLNVAHTLFNPVLHSQPNPYSLISINQHKVESFFGSAGLNLDPTIVRYIKNFYFYCEYVVRLEYAGKILGLALEHGIDALIIIKDKSWSSLINRLINITDSKNWHGLQQFLSKSTYDWKTLHAAVALGSWQDLVLTDFWKSIPINQDNIQQSSTWQLLSRSMVTQLFLQDSDHVRAIQHIQQAMLTYLPHLETALYDTSYNHLRTSNELLQVTLLINQHRQKFWHHYANDQWNALDKEQQTLDFTKTLYFKLSVLKPSTTPPQLSPTIMGQLQKNPHVIEQLVLLGMLKSLQALLQECVSQTMLKKTMHFLEKNPVAPAPSFFDYTVNNEVLYQSIYQLQNTMGSVEVKHHHGVSPQFSFGDVTGALVSGVKKVGSTIEDVSKDTAHAIENKAKDFAQQVKNAGLSAAHFIVSLDKKVANKLIEESSVIHDKVIADIKKAESVAVKGVNSAMQYSLDGIAIAKKAAENAAQWTGGIITKGCGFVKKDKELCQAAGKSFESIADLAINSLAAQASELVVVTGGAIRLSVDAALNIAIIASDVVTGHISDLPSDALDGIKLMARDAASSILQALTIQVQYLMKQLIDIFKFVSYFISLCVRMLIDNITAVVYLSTWLAHEVGAPDETAIASKVSSVLGEHETTISAVITTVLLVSTIPLTGGIDTPLVAIALAATVGPQLFSIYGSYQQDSASIEQKHDEQAFTQAYGTYVENNRSIYQYQQAAYAAELTAKYDAENVNQQHQLTFNKEQQSQTYNGLGEQISLLLGSYWAKILQPSPVAQADIGAVIGYNTGILDLNPSQGFSLYNSARSSFSQEIATHPSLFSLNKSDPLIEKDWFNQMHSLALTAPITTAHLRFKVLYRLDNFYIGIGLLPELSTQTILKTLQAPLNRYHQAKMIVITDTLSQEVSLRVYEHQTKGWSSSLPMPEWHTGTWYHLKVSLDDQMLKIKLWQENTFNSTKEEPETWQSVNTVPASMKTLGIISCASAIEYQIKDPTLNINPVASLRSANNYCPLPCTNPAIKVPLNNESDQEIQSQMHNDFLRNPKQIAPAFDLKICDEDELVKQNFIYTSNYSLGSLPTFAHQDYLVLCQWNNNDQGNYHIIKNTIGQSPAQPLQYQRTALSLITHNVYDCNDGKQLPRYYTHLTDSYFDERPTISTTIKNDIISSRQRYLNNLLKVNITKQTTLSAFSLQALENNHFVYTMPLLDSSLHTIVDTQKNVINDLVVFCLIKNGTLINYGLDPLYALHETTAQAALCSLVTGRVISIYTLHPIDAILAVDAQGLLHNYQNNYGMLNTLIISSISNAQKAYNSFMPAQSIAAPGNNSSAKQGKKTDVASNASSLSSLTPPSPPKAALQSLQNIDQYASNDDTGF